MKYIVLVLILTMQLFGAVVKSPIISVDEENNQATIEIDRIDVGMSGFIVHKVSKKHAVILKNIVVKSYDAQSKKAIVEMAPYDALRNNALPDGRWVVEVGDMAVLAFGYTRGVLIAPSEEIYHRITRRGASLQWVHPDIFATLLSFNGHPTPLREDFTKLSIAVSVGLIFLYLDEKLYTVDSKSFKILNITDAPLKQESAELPFYTRVEEIDAAWWGAGSSELESYEPYYFELLSEANPDSEVLQRLIEKFNKKAKK
ncbi:MAG: plasminogen-binding N-terminal domain-containing protein [Campylobacterota bacterium]|nr:plasminogen-binding N-terminal domain-containing protein [Campylobacterota bacterium]